MAIRIYKKTSAGRRNSSVNLFTEVTKFAPEKRLLAAIHRAEPALADPLAKHELTECAAAELVAITHSRVLRYHPRMRLRDCLRVSMS